jgi:8-oxo-dGTP pyrophosphatase MutT (NUDIX family)
MYKVFIDDKAFFLVFNVKNELKNSKVKIVKKKKVDKLLKTIKETKKTVLVNFKSHQNLVQWLKQEFTVISAAGGLVINKKNKMLFIYRNGKWDLPKGKIEAGEKEKKAAVREVEEECGISSPKINDHIITTYHIYTHKKQFVLKESIWYNMYYTGKEKLVPQKEEGITKVKWIGKKGLKKVLKNTYPSIKDVLKS